MALELLVDVDVLLLLLLALFGKKDNIYRKRTIEMNRRGRMVIQSNTCPHNNNSIP